jgi:hypothetical protein
MPDDRIETLTRIFDGWARGDFSVGEECFDEHATLPSTRRSRQRAGSRDGKSDAPT